MIRSHRFFPRLLLLGCLLGWTILPALAKDKPAFSARKLQKIERYLYGEKQDGEEKARIDRVERDLFGRPTTRSSKQAVDSLFKLLFKGFRRVPCLDMKVNVLEWRIFKETREGTLAERLASLDRQVVGHEAREPLAFRVDQLVNLVLDHGRISIARVRIPRGTPIRLKLGRSLSSKRAKTGDDVPFTIANDLFVNKNVLVLGKGGLITGELARVRRGGRFGRSGYMKVQIPRIESIDSTELPVKIVGLGDDSLNRKKIGMAIGASTLGYLAMGPVGLVGGAFIKGRDVKVAEGTVVAIETLADTKVFGVVIKGRK